MRGGPASRSWMWLQEIKALNKLTNDSEAH